MIPNIARATDWQTTDWHVVESTQAQQKRSAPIRSITRDASGRLLGTRPAGSSIELWSSDNNGIDWTRLNNIASKSNVNYGDSTLTILDNGEILAGYRELHPTLGWSVQVSRSTDQGQTWVPGGTIHDWTNSENEFVGAPHFHRLSNGTLQAYYDSEPAATGNNQYIAVKDGAFDTNSQLWNWSNERIVNDTGVGGAGIRDGLATVVNLGPDLDGLGDRLMVVTEGIGVVGGQAHNLVRAFQVENGGATQSDWSNPLDERVIYQSPLLDSAGHRYNAYAPYALRVGNGPVVVAFSTDEVLHSVGQPADVASTPPHLRHSEIKFVQTTTNFESWSEPTSLWGVGHPEFVGDLNSGDIANYQIGLFELSPNDLLATLDMFGGKQLVFRPSLAGLTADFDEDDQVSGADFLLWQRGFGQTHQNLGITGDATGDGNVDTLDLAQWQLQYGNLPSSFSAAISIPEPSTCRQILGVVLLWCGLPIRLGIFRGSNSLL